MGRHEFARDLVTIGHITTLGYFREWNFKVSPIMAQLFQIYDTSSLIMIYMFKVNNRNKVWHMFKVTIKTPEQRHWRCSGFFIINFEQILHVAVFLCSLWTINAGWAARCQPVGRWVKQNALLLRGDEILQFCKTLDIVSEFRFCY